MSTLQQGHHSFYPLRTFSGLPWSVFLSEQKISQPLNVIKHVVQTKFLVASPADWEQLNPLRLKVNVYMAVH